MNRHSDRRLNEGIIAAVSVGLFFIVVGAVAVININHWGQVEKFVENFTVVNASNTSVQLPVPNVPAAYTTVYSIAFQFALGFGVLQILVLGLRLVLGSRVRRTAETVGGIVFWFGTAYVLLLLVDMKSTLAISQQRQVWFQFWAAIIILIGISLIARAGILIAANKFWRRKNQS